MKKIGFGVVAGLVTLAMVMVGCKNNLEKNVESETTSVELGEIGTLHNDMLTDFYQLNNPSRSATTGTTENELKEYFGDYEIVLSVSYEDDKETYVVPELSNMGIINAESAVYIEKIEIAMNKDYDSLDSLLEEISAIEEDAKANLSETAFEEFESYADTSKASLIFWTENIDILEQQEVDNTRSVFSWIKKNAQRIARAALSDASGASAGYEKGKEKGLTGNALIAYSAACAAASSAVGFAKNEVVTITL